MCLLSRVNKVKPLYFLEILALIKSNLSKFLKRRISMGYIVNLFGVGGGIITFILWENEYLIFF